MILDCCYSGIATQAEKGDPEDADYAKSFQEELRLENASIGTGKGRFIWASADAEKTAREEERKHALTGEMHVHGLFSFHLIEGLRGGPQDAYGRISLRRLEDYLSKAFKDDTKHKPQFHSSSASDINDIFLTTAEEKLKEALNERISEISRYIKGNQPTEVFLAIGIINELEREGLACDELIECCNAINKLLQESHPTAFFWWQKNSETILEQARGISEWYKIFNKVIASFDLATVRQLDWQQRKYVAEVLEVIQSTGEAQEVAKLISIRDLNQRALSGGIPKSSQGQDIRALPPSISTN
jgi:hypothetical protein